VRLPLVPKILRRTFTVENAVSNGVWGLVYLGVYAGVSALVPVILHSVTRLSWPWLAVLGFGIFCLLSAGTLAWWAHQSEAAAPVPLVAESSPLRASLEEAGELGARCATTAKAMYTFLNKNATRTDEPKVVAEYLRKFDARVMGLYTDLITAGLSNPAGLEIGMKPVTSVQDIANLARALTTNGESFSVERLTRNRDLAMGALTKEKLPHKSSCPPRPRVETFMAERSDGIEVETTRCMECGATADRIDIPVELRPFLDDWRTLHSDMAWDAALEQWMDQRRIPESKRGELRERTEAFLKAIMEDAS
jgi:hypothetical protein